MEENLTIEEKAMEIADEVAQDTDYKGTAAYEAAMKMADFVIAKAEAWLRKNATDYYLDKIEDCYGGNDGEPQTWSFPEEFFKRFKNEIKNGDIER